MKQAGTEVRTSAMESRLVPLETAIAARSGGIARRIINFTYDYLERRVQKQVIDGATVTELSSARFIYNGWDIIAEYSVLNGSTLDKLQRTYACSSHNGSCHVVCTSPTRLEVRAEIRSFASEERYIPTLTHI
ncbi:MAG TPA: hypothetical protein PLV87_17275, partial [Opitutaceae bacterium]|nr:hypothetical protein [Opitutaceae bacterium]